MKVTNKKAKEIGEKLFFNLDLNTWKDPKGVEKVKTGWGIADAEVLGRGIINLIEKTIKKQ